jgi:hypothetical protein
MEIKGFVYLRKLKFCFKVISVDLQKIVYIESCSCRRIFNDNNPITGVSDGIFYIRMSENLR